MLKLNAHCRTANAIVMNRTSYDMNVLNYCMIVRPHNFCFFRKRYCVLCLLFKLKVMIRPETLPCTYGGPSFVADQFTAASFFGG